MPVCSLLAIEPEFVRFQWFSEKGKTRNELEISWNTISEVTAFKRDLFAYDLICLVIEHTGGDGVEIDEEDASWKEFVKVLPDRLEGAKAWGDWFEEVAFPAFETKEQVIYQR